MNSGRYFGTITAEQHARSVINYLGWGQEETFGHWWHCMQNNLLLFSPTGWFIRRINHGRRLAFEREQKEKAAAAQKDR
jgi:hypothetical protein